MIDNTKLYNDLKTVLDSIKPEEKKDTCKCKESIHLESARTRNEIRRLAWDEDDVLMFGWFIVVAFIVMMYYMGLIWRHILFKKLNSTHSHVLSHIVLAKQEILAAIKGKDTES